MVELLTLPLEGIPELFAPAGHVVGLLVLFSAP